MLAARLPPFWGPNTRECFNNILTQQPRLEGDLWDGVSNLGKDFIRRCAAWTLSLQCPRLGAEMLPALRHCLGCACHAAKVANAREARTSWPCATITLW